MFFFAGFVLDPDRAELLRPDGSVTRLRPKAFELLVFFAENSCRVIDKRDLMDAVWPGIHVGEDSLFQCIREIRQAPDGSVYVIAGTSILRLTPGAAE